MYAGGVFLQYCSMKVLESACLTQVHSSGPPACQSLAHALDCGESAPANLHLINIWQRSAERYHCWGRLAACDGGPILHLPGTTASA